MPTTKDQVDHATTNKTNEVDKLFLPFSSILVKHIHSRNYADVYGIKNGWYSARPRCTCNSFVTRATRCTIFMFYFRNGGWYASLVNNQVQKQPRYRVDADRLFPIAMIC